MHLWETMAGLPMDVEGYTLILDCEIPQLEFGEAIVKLSDECRIALWRFIEGKEPKDAYAKAQAGIAELIYYDRNIDTLWEKGKMSDKELLREFHRAVMFAQIFKLKYKSYLLAMQQILTEEQIKEIEQTARTIECAVDPAQIFFGDEPLWE